MRKIAVLMLLGLLTTGTAFGITVDGNLSDWGVTVDYTKVDRPDAAWAPAPAGFTWSWAEDSTNVGLLGSGSVGPGYGGQNFDIEAAYLTSRENVLYGAFVSGFDRAGQYGWYGGSSDLYQTGDLFFDIGADGIWDFAIAMSTRPGFVAGQAYIPTSAGTWFTTPPAADFPSSKPAQLDATATFKDLLGVAYAYSEGTHADDTVLASAAYFPADHNIVEVSLDIDYLRAAFPSIVSGTPVVMHYTESCGNDVFDLTGAIIYTPEPGTAALLLMGVVGAYARWRRKGERTGPTA